MRIYMQQPPGDDQSPRFFHLLIQQDLLGGWTLLREWGRQGAAGRLKREHFATHDEAVRALVVVRDQQLARGYRVVFTDARVAPG